MNFFLSPGGGVLYVYDQTAPASSRRPASPPNARIVYREGDYAHAVLCHQDAKDWAARTGAATKDGLYARINRPHHELCPSSCRIVPNELVDQGGWSVTVEFWCDPEALEWLKTQSAPEMGELTVGPLGASEGSR